MSGTILEGEGARIVRRSDAAWRRALERAPERSAARLSFMTAEHHLVRDFVVREMPGRSSPIRPAEIGRRLGLTRTAVERILSDLDRNLFFLVRDVAGGVEWAYPVTTARTPHRLRFSTGERIFGA